MQYIDSICEKEEYSILYANQWQILMLVFWVVMLCRLAVIYQRFGGIYWLHLCSWRPTLTSSLLWEPQISYNGKYLWKYTRHCPFLLSAAYPVFSSVAVSLLLSLVLSLLEKEMIVAQDTSTVAQDDRVDWRQRKNRSKAPPTKNGRRVASLWGESREQRQLLFYVYIFKQD
jgi:hypothetical protein